MKTLAANKLQLYVHLYYKSVELDNLTDIEKELITLLSKDKSIKDFINQYPFKQEIQYEI